MRIAHDERMSGTWHADLASLTGDRAEQQDRSLILTLPDRPQDCLAILADGMGGRAGGALAAQAVIDTAKAMFSANAADNPQAFLSALCDKADDAIRALGHSNGNNPASTCVMLYLCGDEAYWVHVGDSRLYHFGGETLLSHTRDHTVAELRRQHDEHLPIVDAEQDHRLYMCLGGENGVHPEFAACAIGADDWFALSSDGFWQHVGADETAHEVMSSDKPGDCAERLAKIATERAGTGSDNTSLIILTRAGKTRSAGWRRFLPQRLRQGK